MSSASVFIAHPRNVALKAGNQLFGHWGSTSVALPPELLVHA